MTAMSTKSSIQNLPKTTPVVMRSGMLLLPGGRISLNLESPVELGLLDISIRTHRMLGVVQTYNPGQGEIPFQMGCLGRIISFTETDEGCLVVLTGVCRFQLSPQDVLKNPADVILDYGTFSHDLRDQEDNPVDRNRLLKALGDYMNQYNVEGNWSDIIRAPSYRIITTLAMSGPFDPVEKQALLETQCLTDQCCMITTLMEMAVRATHIS